MKSRSSPAMVAPLLNFPLLDADALRRPARRHPIQSTLKLVWDRALVYNLALFCGELKPGRYGLSLVPCCSLLDALEIAPRESRPYREVISNEKVKAHSSEDGQASAASIA